MPGVTKSRNSLTRSAGDDLVVDRDAVLGRRRDSDLVDVRPGLRDASAATLPVAASPGNRRWPMAASVAARASSPASRRARMALRSSAGIRGGEERVLEVARGLVVLLLDVGAVAEVVLARGELDSWSAPGVPGEAGAGARRRRWRRAGPGASARATPDHAAKRNTEHRGVATHCKSVPGPAGLVNLLVGRHLAIAPDHASSRRSVSGFSR